jgi:hypothetical protein
VNVFDCIRLYYAFIRVYVTVFDCMCPDFASQKGVMPMTSADYPHFPFTAGSDKKGWAGTVSLRLESFHNALGSLRCFDATKTTENKKPHFNWFDRDNCFIAGVKRAPQYTKLFWELFLEVASNTGDHGKRIVDANTPQEIEALRSTTLRVVVQEDNDFVNVEIPLISAEMRAMVDNICYMAVYGHRSMFEKISLARRTAFAQHTLKAAREYEDEFYESWKSYRAAHPVETMRVQAEEDSETERLISVLNGDDDDGPAPAGAAAAAAAAPAPAAAPAAAAPAPAAAPAAAAPAAAD